MEWGSAARNKFKLGYATRKGPTSGFATRNRTLMKFAYPI